MKIREKYVIDGALYDEALSYAEKSYKRCKRKSRIS